jgi:hypothetical protein
MRGRDRRTFLIGGLAAFGLGRRGGAGESPPVGRAPRSLAPTAAQVTAVAFRDDGTGGRLAVGGDDGRVRLIDFATGRELATFAGGAGGIRALAFEPAGRRIVAGADGPAVEVEPGIGRRFEVEGGVVFLWDPDAPRPASRIACEAPPAAVAFGPGPGRVSAVDERFALRSWREAGADESSPLRPREAAEMAGPEAEGRTAFAPGAGRAASVAAVRYDDEAGPAPEDRLVLWDAATRRVRSVPTGGRDDAIRAVALTPDGRGVACASKDGRLTLRDFATGAVRAEARADGLGRPGLVAVLDPGAGRPPTIVAAADGRVALWRPDLPGGPRVVAVPAGTPRAVALRDGTLRGVSGGFEAMRGPAPGGLPPHAPLVLWEVVAAVAS